MATVNLLKASFNGKLGEVYGSKQHGNAYAKAIPFSHAPHNRTQTNCVRAFERLNRFSSAVASVAFPYLGLSSKKMLKHNAVAKFFKPLIQDKRFSPSLLPSLITEGDKTEISSFTFDSTTGEISVSVSTSEAVDKKNGHAWFVFVFDMFGYTYVAEAPEDSFMSKTVKIQTSGELPLCCAVFRSDKKLNKFSLNNLSLIVPDIVIGTIFYTSQTSDPDKWSVADGVLTYTGEESYIENGVLYAR